MKLGAGTSLVSQTIAPGVAVHVLPAPRFKTVTLSVFLHRPLARETATPMALLPSVLVRGSRELPTQADLTRALDELYGADLSAAVVKNGEVQSAAFHLNVVDRRYLPDGADVWRRAVEVLAGVVARPLLLDGGFRPDYVEQEKVNLGRQIDAVRNDKARYAAVRLIEEMCRGERFSLQPLGRREDIPRITPQGLAAVHEGLLRTAPVDIFLVGGEDPEDYLPAIRESFRWEGRSPEELPRTETGKAPSRPRQVVEGEDVEQGKLALGYRTGVTLADDDYAALQVYNGTLGGFVHSKLFKNVREGASLAYYAHSQVDPLKGVLVVSSGIETRNFERALAIVEEQVAAMERGDISDEELRQTKLALADRLRVAQDSPSAIVARALGDILGGRRRELPEALAEIERVTREDVVRVASRIRLDTVYFLTRRDDPRLSGGEPEDAARRAALVREAARPSEAGGAGS